jgi:WD40 repeat protein
VAAGRRPPVGDPLRGHDGPVDAVAAAALPDGTPVIISGDNVGLAHPDGTVRVWRLADGTPVGEPLTGHDDGPVNAGAAGALPDGTPVIISGGGDGTVLVWRLADGTLVGEPLTGHYGRVGAVAAGALPDGTPVIISGGEDRRVRVWRLADGIPLVPQLDLPESVPAVAIYGNLIITAAGTDIAVHQLALPRPIRQPLFCFP